MNYIELLVKFWDPLHISGTAKDTDLKFGVKKMQN